MDSEKVLIIKGNYNSFERYYLKNMNIGKYDAFAYYNDRKSLSIIRKIWIHCRIPYEFIWYGNWKKNIKKYDKIIIFDSIVSTKIVYYINKRRSSASRLIFWHWNSLNNDILKKVYTKTIKMCEHWTFDPGDAKQYNMHLNNQFFFEQSNGLPRLKWDVYFIGRDKGRYQHLSNLWEAFNKMGVSSYISVLRDKKSDQDGELFIDKTKSYDDILEDIQQCKCVLELCQEGQIGLTARALEAMFFRKKLITNNLSIIEQTFYHEDNIFLLKDGWESKIKNFLNSPFHIIDNELLYKYSFEGWIQNF